MKKLFRFALVSSLAVIAAEMNAKPAVPLSKSGETVFYKSINEKGEISYETKVADENRSNAKAAPAKADDATYTVTITIDPDNNGKNKTPQGVWLFKDEYISYQSMRKAVNKFTVPAGDYTAQIIFTNNDDAGAILFIPDIKVEGDKDIHLNASMANKKITTAFTLPSGEKAVLPEDNGQGQVADKPYNIATITADIHLMFDGISKGSLQSVIGLGGENYSDLLTLRTNVDSPRGEVSYVVKAEAPGKTGAKYFYLGSTTMDKVGEEIVLTNDARYFHKVSDIGIVRTPAYEKYGNSNNSTDINFYAYSPAASLVGGVSATVENGNELYISTPPVDFSILHPLTTLSSTDYSDEDEWVFGGISTPSFAFNGTGFEFYATQGNVSYTNDKPEWEKTPFNPALTFATTDGITFGDNFAMCVTAVETDPWADVPFSYITPDCYFGNYGEARTVDSNVVSFAVKYNGVSQEVAEGTSLYDWAEKWATNGHTPGVMTYIFTNRNILTDGMAGENICEASFTEGADDDTPPTLQRIMMRDGSGNVTNRFQKPNGATIAIVGGDFIKNKKSRETGSYPMNFTYYTFAEATIEAEYAVHGSSEFHPFAIDIDNDKFFMPAFGQYHSGSLEQIDTPSPTGWYDLKVAITDKAGNKQVQTIAPAFKLDEISAGIEAVTNDATGFGVVGNAIVSADGSEVSVYTLSGIQIANTDLQPGLYIAVSADRSAKIAIK